MINYTNDQDGLFVSGNYQLLLYQLTACVTLIVWSTVSSFLLLLILKMTMGIRVTFAEEMLGPDFTDHGLVHEGNVQVIDLLVQKRVDISKWVD